MLGVGTWWEQKRRRKADMADEDERFAAALDTLRADLDAGGRGRARPSPRRDPGPGDRAAPRRAAHHPAVAAPPAAAATSWRCTPASATCAWAPPVDQQSGLAARRRRSRRSSATAHMPAAPVEVDLTAGGVVGVVGDREGALAVARSLVCQAAVHCGPADLTIGVFCDPGRDEAWSWTTWLPHVRRLGDGSGGQWVSANRARSEGLLRGLRDGIDSHPTPAVLLVLDSDVLTEGRDAPARSLLGHGRPLEGSSTHQDRHRRSPASSSPRPRSSCRRPARSILRVRNDAEGTATRPDDLTTRRRRRPGRAGRRRRPGAAPPTWPASTTRSWSCPGAALPGLVRLPGLLGLDEMTPEAIRKSWAAATGVSTPVGVGEHGAFALDLVRDGPHGLVGGTTGSGKSEFLRSLVAGLAARNDPTRLTFILIDFKGGAAFATCERLPHTIGTVSNLDEQLADRALRALEAEMDYRQRVFAAAGEGIDNLDAYLATNPAEPMPRLLLVIDEFAMLAKEYPDVLSSLVSVAAVGRTLGVHMILATQRPAGVVNEDILANTNLRVALRVQSRDDSINVIGVPAAAAIGRSPDGPRLREARPGRHHARADRAGHRPVRGAVLDAASTCTRSPSARTCQRRAAGPVDDDAPADLDLLIDADRGGQRRGRATRRRARCGPSRWASASSSAATADPGRRPTRAPVGRVAGSSVQVALADDPDRQRQLPAGWDLDRGNLLLMGIPGSGTSTTLASLALTLAADAGPSDLDLLVLDLGSRDLAPLASLPHTAAYVGSGAASREQQVRLLKYLRAELDRRRAAAGPHRRTVVLHRRPGRAQGRVRRLRGHQAAGGALPGLRRRPGGRAVVRGHHHARQGRALRDGRGDHAEVALPARRPLRLRARRACRPSSRRPPSPAAAWSPRPRCRPTSPRRRPRSPRPWRWSRHRWGAVPPKAAVVGQLPELGDAWPSSAWTRRSAASRG